MACVRELHRQGRRLPYHLEVIGFAEEEGQRYAATFLGSGALVGDFRQEWLDQRDAQGITMREAMQHAGLCIDDIPTLRRDPARYRASSKCTSSKARCCSRWACRWAWSPRSTAACATGAASSAWPAMPAPPPWTAGATRPPPRPSWPCTWSAASDGDSVGTMGMLDVPNGSINVVPGECRFSLDLRAPGNAQRDALATDVLAELAAICQRRGLRCELEETLRAAAPSAPAWQARWERAVEALGLPVHRMPSGAGHDAMKLHEAMPQAMLFVRGQNFGISHNPLESTTANDMQLAAGPAPPARCAGA